MFSRAWGGDAVQVNHLQPKFSKKRMSGSRNLISKLITEKKGNKEFQINSPGRGHTNIH